MALRIGPVGPVREAGLGSGAGLGSEVRDARRRVPSFAICPSRAVGVRPPQCVCALLRWRRTHSKCGLAPRSTCGARRCAGWVERRSGPQRRCSGGVYDVLYPRRSRSLPVVVALSRRAGERASSGIQPQGSRSAVLEGAAHGRGQTARRACWGSEYEAAAARSPHGAARAESSDRRVSDPSVERARLRGRGGSGSLLREQQ